MRGRYHRGPIRNEREPVRIDIVRMNPGIDDHITTANITGQTSRLIIRPATGLEVLN